MNKFKLIAAALLAALLACGMLATPVFAQTSELTGGLRGKVTSEDGSPLPGVTLVLSSRNLIRDQVLVSDGDGNFFSPSLAPGDYRVTMQLTGYVTTVVETQVVLGQTTVLNLAMKAGEISEEITVTSAKPVVEKTETESAVVLDKKFTEKLPAGRTYQSLIQFAPGVTGGANPNILGGTSNSNEYLVDGVSIRDPVTGTFGSNLNFDAIEVVDIKLTGVSAEYGQFQGGLTSVITKSGGNTFTGSLRDVITSGRWRDLREKDKIAKYFRDTNGDGVGNPPTDSYSPTDDTVDHSVEFTIGGPIVPDNAWFFLAYRRPDTQTSAQLGNATGGPLGDGRYSNFFFGDYSTGKVTWQVADQHRVLMQYTEDPAQTTRDYHILFFGSGAFDTQNVDNQSQGGYHWVANWAASWTSNFVTDLKASHFENGFAVGNLTPVLPPFPGQPLSGTGRVGFFVDTFGSGYSYDNSVFDPFPEERIRDQFELGATTFLDTALGTHTLKIGAEYQEQERLGASIIAGDAYFYGWMAQDPAGVGGCGNACAYDIDNRSYSEWYDFAPATDAGPINEYGAIYINDDWQLNENWSFNLGIRYEQSINENDVGEKIIDQNDFAPRLGASWDVTGEGRHVVKATAGRYLAGINLTTLTSFVRAAGGQSSYDRYVNLDFEEPEYDEDTGELLNSAVTGIPNWALVAQIRPNTELAQFAPDLKVQYIDELTLGYEFGFSPTMGAKIKLIDRQWEEITTVQNFFQYPSGPVGELVTRIANNSNAERDYQAVQLQFDKRLSNNWELSANYVYSSSEGNVTSDSGFDTFGNYAGVPQATNNKEGPLPWDVEHAFKAQGYYVVPLKSTRHGVNLGGILNFASGNPYARNGNTIVVVGPGADGIQNFALGTPSQLCVDEDDECPDQIIGVATFLEPRGSRIEPTTWTFDVNVGYDFNFTRDVRFEARFEVFNITNNQKPLAINAANSSSFGYATSLANIQAARSWRFNVALLW